MNKKILISISIIIVIFLGGVKFLNITQEKSLNTVIHNTSEIESVKDISCCILKNECTLSKVKIKETGSNSKEFILIDSIKIKGLSDLSLLSDNKNEDPFLANVNIEVTGISYSNKDNKLEKVPLPKKIKKTIKDNKPSISINIKVDSKKSISYVNLSLDLKLDKLATFKAYTNLEFPGNFKEMSKSDNSTDIKVEKIGLVLYQKNDLIKDILYSFYKYQANDTGNIRLLNASLSAEKYNDKLMTKKELIDTLIDNVKSMKKSPGVELNKDNLIKFVSNKDSKISVIFINNKKLSISEISLIQNKLNSIDNKLIASDYYTIKID